MRRILTTFLLVFSCIYGNAQIQQLQKLSQIDFPTTCAGVWHYSDSTGSEYALIGNGDGLVIVDVTNPVTPNVLFTVPAAASLWREVKTYGHFAYAGTEGGGGITVIDLSGLPASYQSQVYTGDGAIAGQLGNSHTVQVFDDYLYIFGSSIGTVMCSLADPWNPTYVGTYGANYVHDGYVLNDTLYSSEIYAGQFSVVDISNKANPVVLESQPTPGAFNHNGWFSDNHQYFYTTDELNNTPLGVFDVSDIQNITLVNTYYNDTMPDKEVHNVRVINDYLICPSYGSQLVIVDAARPQNLVEIARYHTGNYLCWDASPYLPSGNIVASDMDGHFYVFAPYYVRACYLEGNITDNSTGNPLIGATVKILTTPKTAQSNSSGDYKTGYPTAGTFDVEVSQPGYITKTVTGVVLSNGNVTILDVQLDPLSLTINVLDAAGNGVPSALVKVQNTTTDLQFTTDANGSLVVNNIASGNYNITGGKWGYRSGCINVTVGTLGVYDVYIDDGIYDDFTFDFGWSTTSTATAGAWVREEPIGTIFTGTQANPETDAANDCSDHCFITGNGGGSANNDDVDDGTVTLTSPVIDLSGYTDPYFNYQRWFFEQFSSNPASDDTLFISISNGVNTAIVETVYGTSPGNSSWVSNAVRVLDYMPATSNMTFQVLVSDKPFSGNPLEAGLDKFEVSEGPLGIATANMQHNINVYPNPFNDYIEVQLPEGLAGSDAEIQITDISGRQVAAYKVSLAGKITVSTASLNNGIYLLQVSTADVIFAPQKIVRLR